MDHKIVEAFMRVGKCHRTLLEHYLNKDGLYRVQHQLLMCVYKYPDASQNPDVATPATNPQIEATTALLVNKNPRKQKETGKGRICGTDRGPG